MRLAMEFMESERNIQHIIIIIKSMFKFSQTLVLIAYLSVYIERT